MAVQKIQNFIFECDVKHKYQLASKVMTQLACVSEAVSYIHGYTFMFGFAIVRPGNWADVVEVEVLDQFNRTIFTSKYIYRKQGSGWMFVEKGAFKKSFVDAETLLIETDSISKHVECPEDQSEFAVAETCNRQAQYTLAIL